MRKRKFQVGDVVEWRSWGSMNYAVVLHVTKTDNYVHYHLLSSDHFGQSTSGRMYVRLAYQLDHVPTVNGRNHRRNMTLVRRWNRGEI